MSETLHLPPRPRHPDDRPRVPHTAHQRELRLPDGRKLLLDRRSIAFLCQGKPEEFGGRTDVTIIAFKTLARAVPVLAAYDDLKAWWRADAKGAGRVGSAAA